MFSYTTAVLGSQMSVLSSLLPVFCVVSVSLLIVKTIVLCFSYTTAVLGYQMSVPSSLLLVFCIVYVLLLCFDLFSLSSLNEKESTRCSCC